MKKLILLILIFLLISMPLFAQCYKVQVGYSGPWELMCGEITVAGFIHSTHSSTGPYDFVTHDLTLYGPHSTFVLRALDETEEFLYLTMEPEDGETSYMFSTDGNELIVTISEKPKGHEEE